MKEKQKRRLGKRKCARGKILMLIFPFGFIQMKIGIIYNVKLLFFFLFLSSIELNCDCIGFAGPSNWFWLARFFSRCRHFCHVGILFTKFIENNYNSWRLTFFPRKESETTEQLNKWTREIKKKKRRDRTSEWAKCTKE